MGGGRKTGAMLDPPGAHAVELLPSGWQDEVRRLAAERDALILAHNYQLPEIQDVAHHTGDSLALSRLAATAGPLARAQAVRGETTAAILTYQRAEMHEEARELFVAAGGWSAARWMKWAARRRVNSTRPAPANASRIGWFDLSSAGK